MGLREFFHHIRNAVRTIEFILFPSRIGRSASIIKIIIILVVINARERGGDSGVWD